MQQPHPVVEVIPESDPATALIETIALPAGSMADRAFPELALSTEMERRPWITFAGGSAPVAIATVALSMDRALLAAVDDRLLAHRNTYRASGLDKGELYERVAQECLNQATAHLAPRRPLRPLTIRLSSGNAPDIDCVGIGRRIEFIGEVKAMAPPARPEGAAAAFESQLTKLVDQLRKRLEAIDGGIPVLDGERRPHTGSSDTIGLGIVLHTYSASLAYPAMLQLLPTAGDQRQNRDSRSARVDPCIGHHDLL